MQFKLCNKSFWHILCCNWYVGRIIIANSLYQIVLILLLFKLYVNGIFCIFNLLYTLHILHMYDVYLHFVQNYMNTFWTLLLVMLMYCKLHVLKMFLVHKSWIFFAHKFPSTVAADIYMNDWRCGRMTMTHAGSHQRLPDDMAKINAKNISIGIIRPPDTCAWHGPHASIEVGGGRDSLPAELVIWGLRFWSVVCKVASMPFLTHWQDKLISLQIQLLKVNLQLNCGILFFAPWGLMG